VPFSSIAALPMLLVVNRSNGVRVSPRHRRHLARMHDEGALAACVEARREAIIIWMIHHPRNAG